MNGAYGGNDGVMIEILAALVAVALAGSVALTLLVGGAPGAP